MIYDFRDSRGNVAGFEFPIGKAPKIGAKMRRKGKVWTRIPSHVRAQVVDYQMVDLSLPRREVEIRARDGRVLKKGVDPKTGKDHHPITSRYKRVDKLGRPVFRSVHEIREVYGTDAVKKQKLVYAR